MSESDREPQPVPPRRPVGAPIGSLAEYRIREAQMQGKFDQIEGFGQPLQDLDEPLGEDWWLKKKLKAEQISLLPPLLAVRRRIEVVRGEIETLAEESQVRRLLTTLNKEIREAIASPQPGPSIVVLPLDVEAEVTAWQERRKGRGA
ncbi:DnaJ family domain-containing protein [Planctomyces sp. SH-PL14]|uniref:DnaJ family domain-containing protein n=1 Tax=Planctomyces sp. SH-PL14 TaxID=1632864 RepID=UPI00078CC158|nr:DnaJ family domain-containing protein [Planctomyces sp. SH-PL14]AMV16272.1 hypothetical protein VT03_00175 [Planctomyces sp. SH-PL14]